MSVQMVILVIWKQHTVHLVPLDVQNVRTRWSVCPVGQVYCLLAILVKHSAQQANIAAKLTLVNLVMVCVRNVCCPPITASSAKNTRF